MFVIVCLFSGMHFVEYKYLLEALTYSFHYLGNYSVVALSPKQVFMQQMFFDEYTWSASHSLPLLPALVRPSYSSTV